MTRLPFTPLIALPLLAWAGNALYALGAPGGGLKFYSPALVALALIGWVILHGRARYGGAALWRFALIVFAIAWVSETISVLTGLPFGNYHYTEIMAPYLWHVPVFVLPAYALMGYASWSLAALILRQRGARPDRAGVIAVPLLAALAMVVWDLSMDPLRATLEGRWVWLDGGAHYGVPVSNYLGWFLVTWLMFQSFALWLSRTAQPLPPPRPRPPGFHVSIPLAYASFAGEYLLNPLVAGGDDRVVLAGDRLLPATLIHTDMALLCLSTMIPLAGLGLWSAWRPAGMPGHPATLPRRP